MSLRTRYFITVLINFLLGLMHLVIIGKPLQTPLLTFTVTAVLILGLLTWIRIKKRPTTLMLPLTFILGVTVGVYYLTTGQVIETTHLPRKTDWIMNIEQFLFHPFFKDGHISISLDQSSWIGPHTAFGKFLTEIFQVMYMSYYFWGFILMAMGMVWVFQDYKKNHTYLMSFTCTWIGAYTLNYLFYLIIPVVGPEITLSDRYSHPLQGLWLTPAIHSWIDAHHTTLEDCFPSGHVALSWVTAFLALRAIPILGHWMMFCAVMVTLATVYLRYHYIVDVLSSIPLVWFAMRWGGYKKKKSKL